MFDFNSVFDLGSLPVAPEFVETLAENALETAVAALEALRVPENIITLIKNISELGYYSEQCYRFPNHLLHDRNDRFDIEGVVFETINLIALNGGVFRGPVGDTIPRQIPAPMQLEGQA